MRSLSYHSLVWKEGDPNCCPTGGRDDVKFRLDGGHTSGRLCIVFFGCAFIVGPYETIAVEIREVWVKRGTAIRKIKEESSVLSFAGNRPDSIPYSHP
jgi:hypothetical protein